MESRYEQTQCGNKRKCEEKEKKLTLPLEFYICLLWVSWPEGLESSISLWDLYNIGNKHCFKAANEL